jgi:hypothetical protein
VAVCRDMTSGCALGDVAEVVQSAPVPVAVAAARQVPAGREVREHREVRKSCILF